MLISDEISAEITVAKQQPASEAAEMLTTDISIGIDHCLLCTI